MEPRYFFVVAVLGLLTITLFVPVVYAGEYTIPVMALSNSPANNNKNYFGNRPIVPAVNVEGNNKVFFPADGNVWGVEIYDYSGTAGTAEAYSYYLSINGSEAAYLIQNRSVAANERVFTNFSMQIPVSLGNYFEIMRQHPASWVTPPATNIVGGYVFVNATNNGYNLPFQAATSSPADSVANYMGYRPVAPATSAGTNKIYIPTDGNLTSVYVYDNSSGSQQGTNEAVSYYVQVNGASHTLISSLRSGNNTGVGNTAPERIFFNTNLMVPVNRGDYVEFRRDNPAWAVNPLLNIVGGSAFVNTVISKDPQGYKLYVQALTSAPTDAQTVYIGSKPVAPDTTAGRNKVYIRTGGTINHVEMYVYSGTAGSTENWKMYLRMNGVTDYLISTVNATASERVFKNWTMGIPVAVGDYFEIKGVQPTWGTNPATTVYGGYAYIEEPLAACGGSGDIILPPVSDFSANLTSAGSPAIIQFFDQSNNTIPGTTTYQWNFSNGGTGVDSTDTNPTFTYSTPGSYTVNHTISGGSTSSTISKTLTITGSAATAPPNSSFVITLTDTSTKDRKSVV